jgi:2-dehydropantoate 2-reductase
MLGDLLAPLVKKGSTILLFQNGLGAEEEVAGIFPQARVGGALCYVCSNKTGPGLIYHVDKGRILLAAHSNGLAGTLDRVRDDLAGAGVPCEVGASLQTARWGKLVWNIPYNGLSVVLDAKTDEIMGIPASRARARELMCETVEGARACGSELGDDLVDRMMAFTDVMAPYIPSMKLDYDAGRPMEIEYIYRRPILTARKAGCDMKAARALLEELEHAEEHRSVGVSQSCKSRK